MERATTLCMYILSFVPIVYGAALPQKNGEQLRQCGDAYYYPSKVRHNL